MLQIRTVMEKVDPSEFKAMMSREGDVTPVDEIVKAFQTLAGGDDKLGHERIERFDENWGDKMSDEEIDFMVKDAEGKFLVLMENWITKSLQI